jgi:hypothetical protein
LPASFLESARAQSWGEQGWACGVSSVREQAMASNLPESGSAAVRACLTQPAAGGPAATPTTRLPRQLKPALPRRGQPRHVRPPPDP